MKNVSLYPSQIAQIMDSYDDPVKAFRLSKRGKDDKNAIYRTFEINHPDYGWIPVIIQVYELVTSGSGIPEPSDKVHREFIGMVSISFTNQASYTRYDGTLEQFGEICVRLDEIQNRLLDFGASTGEIPQAFVAFASRSSLATPAKEGDGYWINVKIPFDRKEKGSAITAESLPKCEILDGLNQTGTQPNGMPIYGKAMVNGEPINCGNIHEFIRAGSIIFMGQINFGVVYFDRKYISLKGKLDSAVVLPPVPKRATIAECDEAQMAFLLKKGTPHSNITNVDDFEQETEKETEQEPVEAEHDLDDDFEF